MVVGGDQGTIGRASPSAAEFDFILSYRKFDRNKVFRLSELGKSVDHRDHLYEDGDNSERISSSGNPSTRGTLVKKIILQETSQCGSDRENYLLLCLCNEHHTDNNSLHIWAQCKGATHMHPRKLDFNGRTRAIVMPLTSGRDDDCSIIQGRLCFTTHLRNLSSLHR